MYENVRVKKGRTENLGVTNDGTRENQARRKKQAPSAAMGLEIEDGATKERGGTFVYRSHVQTHRIRLGCICSTHHFENVGGLLRDDRDVFGWDSRFLCP
jgi:hypothetical protein